MRMRSKVCPIMCAGANQAVCYCIGEDCAWWCNFATDCSVPLLAGMFADSEICRNTFEKMNKQEGE